MCFILAFSRRLEERLGTYESLLFDCRCRTLGLRISRDMWHIPSSPYRIVSPQMLFLLKNVSKFDWRLSLSSYSFHLSSHRSRQSVSCPSHAAWYQLKVSHDSSEAIIVHLQPKYRPCNAIRSLNYSLHNVQMQHCVSWRFFRGNFSEYGHFHIDRFLIILITKWLLLFLRFS